MLSEARLVVILDGMGWHEDRKGGQRAPWRGDVPSLYQGAMCTGLFFLEKLILLAYT